MSYTYYLSIYFILIICNNGKSLWATYIIKEIYPNNKMDRTQGKTPLIIKIIKSKVLGLVSIKTTSYYAQCSPLRS